MSKPRCDKHKRSLPYCDACKAAVRAAEEAALQAERDALAESSEEEDSQKQNVLEEALREEESSALKEGVGFPNWALEEAIEAEEERTGIKMNVDLAGETDKAWADREDVLNPPDRLDDPWADGKTPAEGDEVGDWVPPCQREGFNGCEGGCSRDCEGHLDPGAAEYTTIEVTPQVKRLISSIEKAISNGEAVTVIMGDADTRLRQEGRKEVVTMVRDYFADSIDTGAFKLLEYLEKQCK